jgi:hypothetical protein
VPHLAVRIALRHGGDRRSLRHGLRRLRIEELDPPVEDCGIERIGMSTVGDGEPHLVGAGEVVEQVGEVRAGLLVLPRAREERRHVDLSHEQLGRERHREVVPVRVILDHLQHVRGLRAHDLVGRAHSVAVKDAIARPPLTTRGRGLRLVVALAGPIEGEPVVEDAARPQGAAARVGVTDNGDRGEVRRPRDRGE